MELAYLTENVLMYLFCFDIESSLGLPKSVVKSAEIFLWVSVYVKVYKRMKERNFKYSVIFS